MIIGCCNPFARSFLTSSIFSLNRRPRVSAALQLPALTESLFRDSHVALSRDAFRISNRGSLPTHRWCGPCIPNFPMRMLSSRSDSLSSDGIVQASIKKHSNSPRLHRAKFVDESTPLKGNYSPSTQSNGTTGRHVAWQHQASKVDMNQIEHVLPSGLLAVFKPKNWTSFDVVAKIKRILQVELQEKYGLKATKLKVGHGGTLDPMATGVLVLGIGSGTKSMADYLAGPKAYIAQATLGTETNTLDSSGKVTGTAPWNHVTADMIESLMKKEFFGDIKQIPPMFSALKQNGKRLYALARNDVEVVREPRDVSVYDIKLLSFTESDGSGSAPNAPCKSFEFYVSCSGGFYVRSLISDLGRACGSAAHMTALERTHQGPFGLKDCLPQEKWSFDEIKKTLLEHNSLSKFCKDRGQDSSKAPQITANCKNNK